MQPRGHFGWESLGGVKGFLGACCLAAVFTQAGMTQAGMPVLRTITELKQAFVRPPDDARIMVRWWWFGPSVKKAELEREMRAMKEGGIGGFEVQATYPLEVDGNFPYLSDEFLRRGHA